MQADAPTDLFGWIWKYTVGYNISSKFTNPDTPIVKEIQQLFNSLHPILDKENFWKLSILR